MPFLTKHSKRRPEKMAMSMERAIKARVQGRPMRARRMRVSEKEFQGLAMRKAMTWPPDAPLS